MRSRSLSRIPRTFVIRVLTDGEFRGQISEPTSDEGWQATFANTDELWVLLQGRLTLHEHERHSSSRALQTHTTIEGENHDA